jgi:hypothetical protein
MDPFEEFEFKPLTDGLGFHNKKEKGSTSQSKSPITGQDKSIEARLTAPLFEKSAATEQMSGTTSSLSSTLPRKNKLPIIETPKSSKVDEVLETLKRRDLDFINEPTRPEISAKKSTVLKTETRKEKQATFTKTTPSLMAITLDTMLIMAGTLLCLIALLVVTKVDLYKNIMNPDQQGLVFVALFGLVGSVSWIYMVAHRLFIGQTPGEWVFETQLGNDTAQKHWSYGLKIAWRSTLVLITGFLPLTALSWITNVDIAGYFSGCDLVKKTDG